MPPLTRAYRATPGGDSKDSALLTLLAHAQDTHVSPGIFSAERIYSICKPETLQYPLTERGWTLVRDLKADQRTRRQWSTGVPYLDGWWYPSGLPAGLENNSRPGMHASSEERIAEVIHR